MIEGIIKKQRENGEPVYFKDGKEITTFTESFYDFYSAAASKLKSFFDLLQDADGETDIPFLAKDLLEHQDRKLSEIDKFIREHFGLIKLVRTCDHQDNIAPETMLDVIFKPANGKAPVTEPSQKDSPGA